MQQSIKRLIKPKKGEKREKVLTVSSGVAIGGIFEERERKLFVRDADVDKYEAGAGVVDDYVFNGEPEKELLLRKTFDGGEAAVSEISAELTLVQSHGIKFGQTRAV